MKLSVKSDYATRAVLGLAKHYHTRSAVHIETLASQESVPPKFLVQILIELKTRRIVKSVRGKQGGYLLARPPAQITFGEILRCVHGRLLDTPALNDPQCAPELRDVWLKLQEDLEASAETVNFQQLLEESAGKARMYYI